MIDPKKIRNCIETINTQSKNLKEEVGLALSQEECTSFVEKVIDDFVLSSLKLEYKFCSYMVSGTSTKKLVKYFKTEKDLEEYKEEYLQGIAEIENRDFGIETTSEKILL